jgi:hypothetical protein
MGENSVTVKGLRGAEATVVRLADGNSTYLDLKQKLLALPNHSFASVHGMNILVKGGTLAKDSDLVPPGASTCRVVKTAVQVDHDSALDDLKQIEARLKVAEAQFARLNKRVMDPPEYQLRVQAVKTEMQALDSWLDMIAPTANKAELRARINSLQQQQLS